MRGRWLLLAAGCGPVNVEEASEVGQLRVCLSVDLEELPEGSQPEGSRYVRYDVTGTITEVGANPGPLARNLGACWGPGQGGRAITVEDAEGVVWRAAWFASEGDLDRSRDTVLSVGDPVSLTFGQLVDFASDRVLVVRRDGVLVYAAEEGLDASLDELDATLLPELDVARGDSTGRFFRNRCGQVTTTSVVFSGIGEPLALDTWVQGTVDVGGPLPLQARNPGAFEYVGELECTDVFDQAPWFVYVP